eukprot:scaffold3849_cov179-Amphora_coffeaeformis.AAC.25
MTRKLLLVTTLLGLPWNALAFVAPPRFPRSCRQHGNMPNFLPTTTTKTTQLSEKNKFDDGTGAGIYILALAVGISAWLFTIPPEFRRAYICPTEDYCLQDHSLCEDCTTWGEWFSGVADYYKEGGGIQWDFSIDPKTLEENQRRWAKN